MAKQDAVWVEIDPETLDDVQVNAWKAYKALYREMKAARERFEGSMSAEVPQGQRMIFGYNFGKLSVAIVEDDRKPAKAKARQMSLAEYLEAQAASGRQA